MSQKTPKSTNKALGAGTDGKVQSSLFKFFGKKPTPSKAAPDSAPSPSITSHSGSATLGSSSAAVLVPDDLHVHDQAAAAPPPTVSQDTCAVTQTPRDLVNQGTPSVGGSSGVKAKPSIKRPRVVMDSDEDQSNDIDMENQGTASPAALFKAPSTSTPASNKRARTSTTPAASSSRTPNATESSFAALRASSATPSKASKRSKSVVTPAASASNTRSPANGKSGPYASDWLLNPRDKEGRFPHQEGYDKSSLWIPKSAWERFSNFEKQFWEVKGTHWDCVVFFQKGKFFELYATDADLALQLFDLKVSDNGRGAMRMAGVPESAFEEWAAKFIARGYRVAKVVQAENAIAKAIRDKQAATKADKIIQRELTCVLTPGTLAEPHFLTNSPDPIYCTSLAHSQTHLAAAFFDVASSRLFLACLETEALGGLDTLLTHTQPREIVVQPKLPVDMMRNIRALAPSADMVQVAVDNPQAGRHLISATWTADDGVPEVVRRMVGAFGDVETSEVQDLVATALGRLIMYLQRLKRHELLSAGATVEEWTLHSSRHMVLDGAALAALAVIDGEDDKSLLCTLDRTVTPGGRRLLRSWLAHPLRRHEEILERQAVVVMLCNDHSLRTVVKSGLRAIGVDLERSLNVQARKALAVLASVIKGLQAAIVLLDRLIKQSPETRVLVRRALKDVDLAAALGVIRTEFVPAIVWTGADGVEFNPDTDAEYLQARNEVDAVEDQIESLRADTQRQLGFSVKLKESGKDLYSFEVAAGKVVPNADKTGATKAVARYQTQQLKELNQHLAELRELRAQAKDGAVRRLQARFSTYAPVWRSIAHASAALDVVLALAVAAEEHSFNCVPELALAVDGASFVRAEDVVHPCFTKHVPNDLSLGAGSAEPRMMLLSGSNAGGKSTVQRTIATAALLAQIGSLVPASVFQWVPFDSIHTRIGARDDLAQGMSTLALELHEMSRIIKHATPSSLVLIDELGRGTSTYDGMAIASSTLFELIAIGCCTIFTTHYHGLVHDLQTPFACAQGGGISSKVKCMQMEVESLGHRQVKFCYNLIDGNASSSLGLAVAHMAGIPEQIVELATAKAKEMEWDAAPGAGESGEIEEDSVGLYDLVEFGRIWSEVC